MPALATVPGAQRTDGDGGRRDADGRALQPRQRHFVHRRFLCLRLRWFPPRHSRRHGRSSRCSAARPRRRHNAPPGACGGLVRDVAGFCHRSAAALGPARAADARGAQLCCGLHWRHRAAAGALAAVDAGHPSAGVGRVGVGVAGGGAQWRRQWPQPAELPRDRCAGRMAAGRACHADAGGTHGPAVPGLHLGGHAGPAQAGAGGQPRGGCGVPCGHSGADRRRHAAVAPQLHEPGARGPADRSQSGSQRGVAAQAAAGRGAKPRGHRHHRSARGHRVRERGLCAPHRLRARRGGGPGLGPLLQQRPGARAARGPAHHAGAR